MNTYEAIKLALPIFAEHKNSNWEILDEALKNSETLSSFSDRLLEFMPLAFGRALMKDANIGFSKEYVRYTRSGTKIIEKERRNLEDEPVYKESFKLALQMITKGIADENFKAVAHRSAELSTITEMMNKSSKAENLVLTPPYLQWRESNDSYSKSEKTR